MNVNERCKSCTASGYLAPELVSFQAYNTQIDVWSLGVILFILLSGTMPYETDDPRKVLVRLHNVSDRSYSYLSIALHAIHIE